MRAQIRIWVLMFVLMFVLILLLPSCREAQGFYPDDIAPNYIDIIVSPIVKAKWNFNGKVLVSPDYIHDGPAYFNKYLYNSKSM